jgi:hypothetical protein
VQPKHQISDPVVGVDRDPPGQVDPDVGHDLYPLPPDVTEITVRAQVLHDGQRSPTALAGFPLAIVISTPQEQGPHARIPNELIARRH